MAIIAAVRTILAASSIGALAACGGEPAETAPSRSAEATQAATALGDPGACDENAFAANVIETNAYLIEGPYVLVDMAENTGGAELTVEDVFCAAAAIREVNEAILEYPVSLEVARISNYDEYDAPGAVTTVAEATLTDAGVDGARLVPGTE
ncbi:MAG: hypothetical protein ACFB00_01110 [Parvularculaceae bacterium]